MTAATYASMRAEFGEPDLTGIGPCLGGKA
jgi:hypothetical protein